MESEIEAYQRLQRTLTTYNRVGPWQYGASIAALFAELRRAKMRIGSPDLKIAAIALANGATLLTRNQKDFEEVPSPLFGDWIA